MQRWEYYSTFMWADVNKDKRDFLAMFPGEADIPKYHPKAMIPELDSMGQDGWELVHMQPVIVGNNYDVCVGSTDQTSQRPWTNAYFCVFKRPVEG
ncbi:MAG TPA: hypothetical protein PKD09_17420 [Aggregatilinea sp.]|jgi:hypothetical protein|uniref:hypothetical protein n=1 Tax=Aggregatilinea sp. TaxID=2806333 RepID=UPI002CA37679|nr:hypothetical protein [Aggregatilinea sp.]HML23439.1 hypothetical protein [Aggregatilinea sp.]